MSGDWQEAECRLTHGKPAGSTAVELVVIGLIVPLICVHMTCRSGTLLQMIALHS